MSDQWPQPSDPQQGYPPPPPNYGTPPPPPNYLPPPPNYPPPTPYATVGTSPAVPVQTGTSGMAIAALVCGILALCTGFTAIGGIIFGHLALNEINRSGGMVQGRGMALTGLIIGYAFVGIFVIAIIVGIISGLTSPHYAQ